MNSPWKELPEVSSESSEEQNFVLECDRAEVIALNKKNKQIHVNIQPEPFSGRIDAPVVILMRMPKFTPEKDIKLFKYLKFAEDLKRVREQEIGKVTRIQYPFYHLNPAYNKYLGRGIPNPGYEYWEPKMKELICECGLVRISQSVLLLQSFPYKTNMSITKKLPSVETYTIHLLREALNRDALVVLLSAGNFWKRILSRSEFAEKKNCIVRKRIGSGHCTNLSRDNLELGGFERILERILDSNNVPVM